MVRCFVTQSSWVRPITVFRSAGFPSFLFSSQYCTCFHVGDFFVPASYLLIAAYLTSIVYACYRWSIEMPPAVLGFALVITITSILISSRFGFILLGCISTFIIVLWYFQFNNIIPIIQQFHSNGTDALVITVLFSLITTVAWLSNREVESSLIRARKSEHELRDERDSLEVKVGERTRELRAAQIERIDHLYRFAEFGELASGLFHDVLNLLNVVSMQLEKENISSAKELENAMGIQAEIERFRDAIRKQLQRNDEDEMFSLRSNLEDVLQLLAYRSKREGVYLMSEYRLNGENHESDAFPYFGSPLKFHQVAMNLILNAIESFDGFGKNGLRKNHIGESKRVLVSLTQSAASIVLKVADNGCGIPREVQQKVFDPFFTTKHGDKKGTGIGLAITKRIVEKDLRGTIAVEDSGERGTVFTVTFPCTIWNSKKQ